MNDNLITEIIDLNKVKANLLELQKMWEQLITTLAAKSGKDLKFDNLAQNLKTITTAETELSKAKQASLEVDGKKVKITAEIIGNYEKYSKEEQKIIENEIKRKAQVSETNKLLKDKFTNEQDLVKVLQRETKSIADLDKQNKDLQRIQQKLNLTTKEGLDANAKINTQIEKNKETTKEYTNVLDKQKRNIGNYKSATEGATGATGKLGASFAAAAVGIGIAIAAARKFTRYIKDIVSTFAEFDQTQRKLQVISGATAKEMDNLRNSAKKIGATTEKTAQEVSLLQLNLAKLGFTANEIDKTTASIVGLSIATGEDLAQSATTVAGILNAFNLDASESARVADIMSSSFSKSALDLNKFKDGMSKFAPVAEQLDWSIEKTTAYLGVLADANIDAGTASAQLRNVMLILNQEGISLEEALEKLSGSTNLLADANEMFGKRAAPVVAVLAENQKKAKELEQTFLDASGSAEAMANMMADTLYGDIKKAESSIEGLKISIGESENEGLRGAIQGFTSTVDKISEEGTIVDIFNAIKEPAKSLRDAFDPLVKLFGKAGIEIDALGIVLKVITFVFNTFGLLLKVIAGYISAVVNTIVGLYEIFNDIKKLKFQDVLNVINKAIVSLLSPITNLIGMTDGLKKFFGVQRDEIKLTAEEYEKLNILSGNYIQNVKDAAKEQVELNKITKENAEILDEQNKALEEANKRYADYLANIKKANEEAKLSIELGENRIDVRKKEIEAIYSATKAYFELNGYTADEIRKLKELRAEIDKLNTEISNAPKLIDKLDVENIESASTATGEITMNMRDTAPAINDAAAGLSKMDLITAKLRNAFNDFFGATEPIEDWRDTFRESITTVLNESFELYNQIIDLENKKLDQELDNLDRLHDKQMSGLESAYDRRKKLLEATIDDEEQLAAELARIEEEKADVQGKFQDEKFKKEQEIAKKQAILAKKKAKMEVAAGSASALVEAIKLIGIATTTAAPGDPYSLAARIAAALAAALTVVGAVTTGIAKVKAIEIPQFWAGGEAQEGQLISVAERGKELAVGKSGKSYMFDKRSVFVAPEKMRIFSNKETKQIMEKQTINNNYEKSNNVNLTVNIDNERHKKYFKLN